MQAQVRRRRRLQGIERGIPASYMYDPEHYKRELEVFWYNMWINVGREEEIPNPRDYVVKSVGEQNLVVSRDLKGNVRAFHNTCRHRGSILCTEDKGRFEGGSIVCPYHAWTLLPGGEPDRHAAPVGIVGLQHERLLPLRCRRWHMGRLHFHKHGRREGRAP